MGYNLSRMDDGAEWTCNNPLWAFLLTAANRSGWQPIGTFRIDDESGEEDQSWDKENYQSNDGQGVSGKDAENFAKALQSYLVKEDPEGIERKTIESFLLWVCQDDAFPGFEIY